MQSINQSLTSTIAEGELEETKYILSLARQSGWDPKQDGDDYLAIDYAINVKQAMLDGNAESLIAEKVLSSNKTVYYLSKRNERVKLILRYLIWLFERSIDLKCELNSKWNISAI